MTHISGQVVAVNDGTTFDVVGNTPGPAGSLSAVVCPGVRVDVDAGSASSVTLVSVEHQGSLSDAQQECLRVLYGDAVSGLFAAFESPKTVRLNIDQFQSGNASRSSVSASLVSLVSSADSLERIETPMALRPLLELSVVTSADLLSLAQKSVSVPSVESLARAIWEIPRRSRHLLEALLTDAKYMGVLSGYDTEKLLLLFDSLSPSAEPRIPLPAFNSEPAYISFSRSETRSSVPSWYTQPPNEPLLVVDDTSLLCSKVYVKWVTESNIQVTLKQGALHTDTVLWARARRDRDNVIVAIAPLDVALDNLTTLLLVPNTDHYIVDIVSDVSARILSPQVGALSRAYEAGRQAGRLERLGDTTRSQELWQSCATWHSKAGDDLRNKGAMSLISPTGRPRRRTAPSSFSDHILEGL